MKVKFILGVLMVLAEMSAGAAIYSNGNVNGSGTSLSTAIPDNNPSGIASQITVSGAGSMLNDITVTLNVSGGYNGDLYAYLTYDGQLVTLLNRVGMGTINGGTAFGSPASGFNNVVLNSTGSDLHWTSAGSGLPLSGTYSADGRNGVSPFGSPTSFNANGTVTLDGSYAGMNPNGTWSLFFADLSAGGVSTLQGWSLDITAVPEPVNVALAIFGGVLAVWSGLRWLRNSARVSTFQKPPCLTNSHKKLNNLDAYMT